MSDRIAHRGPDDHGLFRFQGNQISCQLAHRRLSIIDLSDGGHQPFSRHGLTLCYNGELYNFRSLRTELAAHGSQFSTNSDTEVVLEAWRRLGPRRAAALPGHVRVRHLRRAHRSLVLARDQLGIKPLHYLPRKDGVVFASELKSIVSALGRGMQADPGALVASLLYYWVPPNAASSRGREAPAGFVGRVPPRRYATRSGGIGRSRRWQRRRPPDLRPTAAGHRGVRRRPPGRRRPGVQLPQWRTRLEHRFGPGQAVNPELDAYTITFRPQDHRLEAMPDDADLRPQGGQRSSGSSLHEIEASPDIVELLPAIVDVLDEPIGDPAAINTLLMCEAARDAGVKVVLSGMGADELFGGYRKHLACMMADLPTCAEAARRASGRPPTCSRSWPPVAACDTSAGRSDSWTSPSFPKPRGSGAVTPSTTLRSWLTCSALTSAPRRRRRLDEHDAVYADSVLADPVNRMCLSDSRLFLPGLNLAYTDRASMAASVEVRVPFVDPTVVAAAFSLPGSAKVRGRTTKVALKDAAAAWLPPRSLTGPRPLSAPPCGLGSPVT